MKTRALAEGVVVNEREGPDVRNREAVTVGPRGSVWWKSKGNCRTERK